jgi:hypothetical protein
VDCVKTSVSIVAKNGERTFELDDLLLNNMKINPMKEVAFGIV